MHKDTKKAYDTAIALQTILENQLIDTVTDDYFTKLWDPDEGYNQNVFWNIIFHIFVQYILIKNIMVNEISYSSTNQWASTNHWPST